MLPLTLWIMLAKLFGPMILAVYAFERTGIRASKLEITLVALATSYVAGSIFMLVDDITEYFLARKMNATPVKRYYTWWPGSIDFVYACTTKLRGTPAAPLDHALVTTLGKTNGIIRFRAMGRDVYYTDNTTAIGAILAKSFDHYTKGEDFKRAFGDFLGNGIFSSDQSDNWWAWHRKSTKPFFAKSRLSDFTTFESHTKHLLSAIDHAPSDEIDIQDLFGRFTLDAGVEFLFGYNLDSMGEAYTPTSHAQSSSFLRAFNEAQEASSTRVLQGDTFLLTEAFHNPMKAPMAVIRPLLDRVVDAALARRKSADLSAEEAKIATEHATLLDYLLDITEDKTLIRSELLNILLAARDTTASLLTSVCYELANHPEALKRLREEIAELPAAGVELSYEQITPLRYLRAVLNETLRLYPSVPLNVRFARHDNVIEHEGQRLFIRGGTRFNYSTWRMQRCPELWGDDAEEWKPERWLDERIKVISKFPHAFVPFSAGPRLCIGQNYAYQESSYCLIRLLQKYQGISLTRQQRFMSCITLQWRAPNDADMITGNFPAVDDRHLYVRLTKAKSAQQ
ncbi:uncharacterized protein L969DRAFT_102957 [Mixia osmundae IAM 14324]|uniref:Cytochrome P450 n=1 Tax=Mixia osmundae (strain CBS 9802 / IAM 14324 / JCM 22182 / KY 12970) TaxID=764103 RepID=G7E900_MIXOS|nr:uncharacterized protein L969DRAFT_102957 [Mixia osmundae IAM 14324]KEI40254.1 hypothetical protein L969DRAFT_102957 [Mixia osmundae IAM 14324]GAA99618.1 hypothetical protein E5Q_06319 [Mixia osmundae IAM 14324]